MVHEYEIIFGSNDLLNLSSYKSQQSHKSHKSQFRHIV